MKVASQTLHVLLENLAWRILSRPPGNILHLAILVNVRATSVLMMPTIEFSPAEMRLKGEKKNHTRNYWMGWRWKRKFEFNILQLLVTLLHISPASLQYLHNRGSRVLCQSQQNADTGVEVLTRTHAPDVSMEAAKSQGMSCPGSHIPRWFQSVEAGLC